VEIREEIKLTGHCTFKRILVEYFHLLNLYGTVNQDIGRLIKLETLVKKINNNNNNNKIAECLGIL